MELSLVSREGTLPISLKLTNVDKACPDHALDAISKLNMDQPKYTFVHRAKIERNENGGGINMELEDSLQMNY